MESAKKSKNWGGAREGAGRKAKDPSEKKVLVSVYIREELKDRLQAAADREGVNISALIARWAETL